MSQPIWQLHQGNGPLVATAIHDGHAVRPEVAEIMAISATERLREEDPFTGQWVTVGHTQMVGTTSRFEVDLNRARHKAIYLTPEEVWGLKVWQEQPSAGILARSLAQYDAFYHEVHRNFTQLERQFGYFVVLDLHSYNHRRAGPGALPADPGQNPEINVGTHIMDRQRWAPVVERFIADLQAFNFLGRRLDVRENIRFRGGHFARWTHQNFPQSACVLAIEAKKFFVDEWTGQPDPVQLNKIGQALQSTGPGILETLEMVEQL